MKTRRYFCVGSDLDDLERIEEELEAGGVLRTQVHLLTLDDAGADAHKQLNDVHSLAKKDLYRSGMLGLAIGVAAALLVLTAAYFSGWSEGRAGWLPFIFLAVVLLGFFTWEGGLWGIQNQNRQFQRFAGELGSGKHLLFADLTKEQEATFSRILSWHPQAQPAGVGDARPRWMMIMQHRLRLFLTESMP